MYFYISYYELSNVVKNTSRVGWPLTDLTLTVYIAAEAAVT